MTFAEFRDRRKILDIEAYTKQALKAEVIPGLEPSFSQPIRDNVLESISQIDGQIVVKVFGDDLAVLKEQSQQVLAAISDVPGVARAMVDRQGELPQELIQIDRGQAARYGLNIVDIQDVIETVLGGREATVIWEGEKKFSVVVRVPTHQRTLTQLRDILLAQSLPPDWTATIFDGDNNVIARNRSHDLYAGGKVSKRFHVPLKTLKARNNLSSPIIKTGEFLIIGH